MSAKHTPGKLAHEVWPDDARGTGAIWSDPDGESDPPGVLKERIAQIKFLGADRIEEFEANAARVVACWNACEGIEDPAKLREEHTKMLEALSFYADPASWSVGSGHALNMVDDDTEMADEPTPWGAKATYIAGKRARAVIKKYEGRGE